MVKLRDRREGNHPMRLTLNDEQVLDLLTVLAYVIDGPGMPLTKDERTTIDAVYTRLERNSNGKQQGYTGGNRGTAAGAVVTHK